MSLDRVNTILTILNINAKKKDDRPEALYEERKGTADRVVVARTVDGVHYCGILAVLDSGTDTPWLVPIWVGSHPDSNTLADIASDQTIRLEETKYNVVVLEATEDLVLFVSSQIVDGKIETRYVSVARDDFKLKILYVGKVANAAIDAANNYPG